MNCKASLNSHILRFNFPALLFCRHTTVLLNKWPLLGGIGWAGILLELLQASQRQMLGKTWNSVLAALVLSSGPGCHVGDVM